GGQHPAARKCDTSPERQRRELAAPVAGAPGLCAPLACPGRTQRLPQTQASAPPSAAARERHGCSYRSENPGLRTRTAVSPPRGTAVALSVNVIQPCPAFLSVVRGAETVCRDSSGTASTLPPDTGPRRGAGAVPRCSRRPA